MMQQRALGARRAGPSAPRVAGPAVRRAPSLLLASPSSTSSSAARREPHGRRPIPTIARAEPPSKEEQRASNGLGNLFLRDGAGEDLDSRIASGEFSDAGSTKEKVTRPVRKALAQDPTGVGE
jgi:beta-ring hydroxylase